MFCQSCGVEAPTKYVDFYQNIGAVFMRLQKSIEGNLCKSCIHKHFWEFTAVTFFFGWFGMVSVLVTPIFLLNNVGRYLFCLTMPPVPPDARAAVLTEEAAQRLQPHLQDIFERLGQDEKLETVAEDVALRAGVTPGQVSLYVGAVVKAMREKQG